MNQRSERSASNFISLMSLILPPFILLFITGIFYYPSLTYPFQFDDIANITKKFDIRFYAPWKRLFRLRWLGEWLNTVNYHIGRFDPFSYRLFNLAVHLAAGIALFYLVYLICSRAKHTFLKANALLVAFFTSGLFLLHPVQTQSVSYVIQARLEGLASFFVVLTLVIFLLAAHAKRYSSKMIGASLLILCAFISCGTKEIVIVTPLLALLIDWLFIADYQWASFKKRIWLHALLAATIVGTFAYYESVKWFTDILTLQITSGNNRGNILTTTAVDIITPYHFLISEFKVILHYFVIFLWPFNICVEYDWKLSESFFSPDSFFPFLVLAAVGIFILMNLIKKRYTLLNFGLLWFLIAVAPRSSIVPSAELVCDYKAYLAGVGVLFLMALAATFCITKAAVFIETLPLHTKAKRNALLGGILLLCLYGVLVTSTYGMVAKSFNFVAPLFVLATFTTCASLLWILRKNSLPSFLTRQSSFVLGFLFFLLPLGYGAFYRNHVWKNPENFWADVVIKAPTKARAHNNYGVSLSDGGKYDEAINHYYIAIKLDAEYCDPWCNLAVAYSFKSQLDRAIWALKNAIRILPYYPEAYNNLGSFYILKKDYDSAEECFRQALKYRPHYGKAYLNWARLHLEKGNHDAAWEMSLAATTADLDNYLGFSACGDMATILQKYPEAIVAYEESIARTPQGVELESKMLLNLANSYFSTQKYTKALAIYETLAGRNPQNPTYFYNLGESHFSLGNFDKALIYFTKVVNSENPISNAHVRMVACFQALGHHYKAKDYLNTLVAQPHPEWLLTLANKELDAYKSGVYA